MNIEDCKEGIKVRYEFDGETDYGTIVKYKGSIWEDDSKDSVWATWDSSNHEYPLHVELKNITPVEEPLQDTQVNTQRKYSKEEIIEYLTQAAYHVAVYKITEGLDDYFSADNEEERKAINLLTSKGYTVKK